MDIHVFIDTSLQLYVLLWIYIWISLDFYEYPFTCYGSSIQGRLNEGGFNARGVKFNLKLIVSWVKNRLH